MARRRKTKHTKDLRGLNSTDQRYWDEILRRQGFSMTAGQNKNLVYVGDIEKVEAARATDTGRVVPKPNSL